MAKPLRVVVLGDARALEAMFAKASAATSSFANKAAGAAKVMGLGLAGAGVAAVKMAGDYQESMQKIVGLVGVSQKQVDAWSKQILGLATKLPQSPKELADAMFFITSAGLRGSTALAALKASATAAAAGLGDTQTVADAVTSAMNAYGAKTLSAARATDVLVATVREGKVEPDQLAGVLGRILPMASQLHVSFNQVGASMAAMTRVGLDANTAATGLRAIFSGLTKVTPQTAKELHKVGLSADGLRKEIQDKGLLSVFETLQTTFHGNVDAMARVFPNVRALTGFFAQMGKQTASTEGIFKRMADTTGTTNRAFAAVADTANVRLKTALSSIQVAMIKLGSVLLPIVARVADAVGRAADAFSSLSPHVQRLVVVAGGAAIGLAAVTVAIDAVGAPIFAVVAALAALGAAFAYEYRHSERFREAVRATEAVVKRYWPRVREIVTQAIEAIAAKVRQYWPYIERVIRGAMYAIHAVVDRVTQIVRAIWTRFGSTIVSEVQTAWAMVDRIVRDSMTILADAFRLIGDVLRGRWSKAWNDLKGIVRAGLDIIRTEIVGAGKMIYEAAVGLGRQLVLGVAHGLEGLAGTVKNKVVGTVTGAIHAAGSLLHGSGEFQFTKHAIGKPMIHGIGEGIIQGQNTLTNAVATVLRKAIAAGELYGPKFVELGRQLGIKLSYALKDSFTQVQKDVVGTLSKMGLRATGPTGPSVAAQGQTAPGALANVMGASSTPNIPSEAATIAASGIDTTSGKLPSSRISGMWGGRIAALASGGVVTRPTLAVVGERGPEAVVPLGRGGGVTRIEVPVYLDGRVIARAVVGPLRGEIARDGMRNASYAGGYA